MKVQSVPRPSPLLSSQSTTISKLERLIMSSTSHYLLGDFKSCDPDTLDPIWELVEQYRSICQDKHALQEELLRELDEREQEAEMEVEKARIALAEIRMGRPVAMVDRSDAGGSTWACGNQEPGERPAITDLDGPREDPIRNGEVTSRGAQPGRLASNTPNIPPCARVGAPAPAVPSPDSCTSTCPAASAPDAESSCLPADGSVFDKYDKMIAALRTRSPPITLAFIPREEIPWPLLPSDGIYPVALGGKKKIDLDKLGEFVAGYALWRGKPLGKILNVLLGHWIAMDKRLKEASERMGQEAPEASSEASKTRRAIRDVRSKLMSIVAEQGR